MYYVTFLIMLLLSRKPVEKFISVKRWEGFFAFAPRVWVVYLLISLNDFGWYIWS